jgi:hyperosmotically inducible periplasmic protein
MRLAILVMTLSVAAFAQQPDNTKVNERDRNAGAITADQQGNSKEDVSRTAAIRKAITDHKDLSTYAQNVKIITLNSKVTLRGPVRDEQERTLIGKIATDIAGVQNVKNELEIAPAKK